MDTNPEKNKTSSLFLESEKVIDRFLDTLGEGERPFHKYTSSLSSRSKDVITLFSKKISIVRKSSKI